MALLGLWRVLVDSRIAQRVMGHELVIHHLRTIFTVVLGGGAGRIV